MKKRYRMWLALLCGISILTTTHISQAVNYDQKIKEAEQEQKSYEKKADELQKEMEEIEASKEDTLAYIEKLDKKTSELEEELENLEAQIGTAQTAYDKVQEELAAAEAEEKKQYDAMKKRIKYMYENGNQEYLEILFGATSIQDLLNRSEYVEKISDYDKNIFEEYRKIKSEVEEKEQESQTRLQELQDLESETEEEKAAVQQLKADKKKQLKEYKEKLKESESEMDAYTKQALEAEKEVEQLLQQKQDELDKELGAGGGNSGGSSGKLSWPLSGGAGRISSGFGNRTSPTAGASTNHKGLDIAISSGTPILAAGSGKVATAAYSSSAGNYVMIAHGSRLYTVYMHCSKLAVKEGETVSRGQVIAYVGSTGISTGAHLHFGVMKNGSYVNPLNYVSQ